MKKEFTSVKEATPLYQLHNECLDYMGPLLPEPGLPGCFVRKWKVTLEGEKKRNCFCIRLYPLVTNMAAGKLELSIRAIQLKDEVEEIFYKYYRNYMLYGGYQLKSDGQLIALLHTITMNHFLEKKRTAANRQRLLPTVRTNEEQMKQVAETGDAVEEWVATDEIKKNPKPLAKRLKKTVTEVRKMIADILYLF